jgi:hypothetical protein
MPTDPTAADRQRRYRARQAGLLPPVKLRPCATCPRLHTGIHGNHCWECWEKHDPAGRLARAQRKRNQRTRDRARANLDNP